MPVICFGKIKEEDYGILQSFCMKDIVRDDYASYLQNIIRKKKEFSDKGCTIIDVDIDATVFKEWFKQNKKASHRLGASFDILFEYSAIVHGDLKKL